ncbi:MAG: type I DNA topoisomerase [Bacteroidota bacterium]|nr:type I DNA topoisomerase [Candidatus Kapabacteria bacterium]MDW8220106.1 type I DNA topoisomerase [Bacteroidota bacterium]
MIKNLVIVESPAKAKTIEKFLGQDFTVKSCFGHIRDLVKSDDAIDIQNGFTPKYEITPDKRDIVETLKKLAAEAETVWLASDEDREGEAISWHLVEALELEKDKTKRIVFHEITKPAIIHAVQNPRDIDENLVNAQQARRVLDRLVGFELSPLLWRKVRPNLSAGRVQSVAVRLIVEREREIMNFIPTSSFRLTAEFEDELSGRTFTAELPKRFDAAADAEKFLHSCKGAVFTVQSLETKLSKKSPSAPFTTSTLQQEASRKLGYSISQTTLLAQRLYEHGHITYMRTDSVHLSDLAIRAAQEVITRTFGREYSHPQQYITKNELAQEAHEAIRPTDFTRRTLEAGGEIDAYAVRLYELIWKRAVASQMADAQLERTIVNIGISTVPELLTATGEVLKFDGFLKLYLESTDDDIESDEHSILPPLQLGTILKLHYMTAVERFTKPAPRYTEASLVKKLEELGIGRPSTYAPTISTIQKRGYVVKEDREGKKRDATILKLQHDTITTTTQTEQYGAEKNKLFPSDIGMLVTDFLMKYFYQIMDYNFTATVEKEFDEIASGKKVWNKMIESFYIPFHQIVEQALHHADRQSGERLLGKDPETGRNVYARLARYGPVVQIGDADDDDKKYANLRSGQSIETITLEEALRLFTERTDRLLGIDPNSGKNVYVRMARYGPVAQIGEPDDTEKQYASLRPGQTLDTITLEEALELFRLPRIVGKFESKDIKVALGRFGPYILHDGSFYSLTKHDDPYTISADRAIEIILAKRQAEHDKIVKEFTLDTGTTLRVLKDRGGHCLAIGKQKVKLPKGTVAEELTLQECLALAGDIALKAPTASRSKTKRTSTTAIRQKSTVQSAKKSTKPSNIR